MPNASIARAAEQLAEGCEFPGCPRARQAATAPGPAPRYCDDDRHDRKSAYEARKRLARQRREQQSEQQEPLRDAASVQVPGPVEMGGLRLRDVAARIIETFEREGQVSREYMDALVASVSDITDAEGVEANLHALKAHHALEVAQVRADLAQHEADLRAAQRLAEESSEAAGALHALNASLQERVHDLEPRLADAEASVERLTGDVATVTGQRDSALVRVVDELEPALAEATAQLARLQDGERALREQVRLLTVGRDNAVAGAAAAQSDRDDQVRAAAEAVQAADRQRELTEQFAVNAAERARAAEQLRDRADEQTRRADASASSADGRAQAAERREEALRRDLEAQQGITTEAQRAAAVASQRAEDAEVRARALTQRLRDREPESSGDSGSAKTAAPTRRGSRPRT